MFRCTGKHTKSGGMRRTYEYAAMTKDECNTVDGRFPTASSLDLYKARS